MQGLFLRQDTLFRRSHRHQGESTNAWARGHSNVERTVQELRTRERRKTALPRGCRENVPWEGKESVEVNNIPMLESQ